MPNDIPDLPDHFLEGAQRMFQKMDLLREHEVHKICGCSDYIWGEPCTYTMDCPEHGMDTWINMEEKHLEITDEVQWDGRVEVHVWVHGRSVGEWSDMNRDCAEKVLAWYKAEEEVGNEETI